MQTQMMPCNVPLASPDAIATTRQIATTAHYPLSRVAPLLAGAMEQRRAAHIAQFRGDLDGELTARLALLDLTERINAELDRAAETGLALLSLAVDRRPDDVRELLARAAKGVRHAAA